MVRSYRELAVWLEGMNLVTETYRLSRQFPTDERFGLTSQMRRSAVSIPANIAEGHGRSHRGDFLHHVSFARGSLAELETHCSSLSASASSVTPSLRRCSNAAITRAACSPIYDETCADGAASTAHRATRDARG
jgi:four helix bundle protein